MAPLPLVGSRLRLREFRFGDWPEVHEWGADPEVCRYEPWGPNTPEDTRAFVQRVLDAAAASPRTEYTLLAELQETAQIVSAGVLYLRNEANRTGSVGYVLKRAQWGHGFGTEIARLLLRFGFERFGLHRIYATCDPWNAASAHILQKIGMRHEGVMRESVLIRDGWRDSDLYAILASDRQG